MAGASTTPIMNTAIAVPRFSAGKISSMMACAIGIRAPPPRPCNRRVRIIISSDRAMPLSTEATVNRPRQYR